MHEHSQSIVLITDISTRKSFDLANILTGRGVRILLCDDLKSYKNGLLLASYGKEKRTELLRKDHFDEDMLAISKKYADKKLIYFPVEEDTTLLMYDFLENNDVSNIYANLPPKISFNTVRDKKIFSSYCKKNSVSIPKEYDAASLLEKESLPSKLIVKPRIGSGSLGIKFIDSKDQLESLDIDFDDYIIQKRLENSGDIEGAFFLFDKGEMLGFYSHKRIRTYPRKGGVSVYSKATLNRDLEKAGRDLLEKLDWSGIAMVEFLYDEQCGEYKVIEVNPRSWGSLMLSEFCGSRMIENYCNTALGLECAESKIETNRYIRWFFPWDLILYIRNGAGIEGFWNFKREDCCYINFTYTSPTRALLFTLYNLVDLQKIAVLFRKVFQR